MKTGRESDGALRPAIAAALISAALRRWVSAAVLTCTVLVTSADETPAPSAVACELSYTAEVFSLLTGGLNSGATYHGLAETALEADLATLAGAPADTRFRISALFPHGGDFSGKRLGDLQGASNIAAYEHPVLYELWFGGKLAGGRIDLRAGRLVADSDFATTEGGGVFLNSSFGWPAFISANTRNTGPAYYRSALGVFGHAQLTSAIRVQAGLYDGDTFDDADGDAAAHPNGLHFELGHGQGAFAIAEIIFETNSGPALAPRPGAFKLGAWRHTADFVNRLDSAKAHSGNHGVYIVGEQMLWREASPEPDAIQGLTLFARTGFSPDDRSLFAQTADAGLSYTGLLPGRDTDTFGLGAAWARIGNATRQAERLAGAAPVSDYELVIEACYAFSVSERCRVVADFQWVRHPGGSSAVDDALVIGLRTYLTF